MVANKRFTRILKKVEMAQFKALSRHLLERTVGIGENFHTV
jgi:hypothetical protein